MDIRSSKKILILVFILTIINIKASYAYCNHLYNGELENLNTNNQQEVSTESSRSKKIAYITIDDGPSKYTEDILKILNKYNAKGTFFLIDQNMKNYPNQVKQIVESGNAAGLHSVSHDIHKLYESTNSAKEEFDLNNQTFYNITGKYSSLVRLPYGSKPYTPTDTFDSLVDAGYKVWDWNIDTQDWKSTSNEILENTKKYSKNKNEIVLLIHEKKQTVEALDSLISYLVNEGYELLPINEYQEPKNFWLKNLYK